MSVRLDLKLLQQPNAETCIQTCCRMILDYLGYDLSHADFLYYLPENEEGYLLIDGAKAIKRLCLI